MAPAVRFVNVSRRFGSVRAVDGVTLDIAEGEFFAMLGPSGSGKTTCLRLIAGFEQPDEGHIEIFGETAEGVPPYKRNVNTVFQDYALFPHMTVGENVAYGLKIKGVGSAEREGRRAYFVREIGVGAFSRSFRLPTNVDPDKVSASYKDGMLSIDLPKKEEAKPRRIVIETK